MHILLIPLGQIGFQRARTRGPSTRRRVSRVHTMPTTHILTCYAEDCPKGRYKGSVLAYIAAGSMEYDADVYDSEAEYGRWEDEDESNDEDESDDDESDDDQGSR